MNPPTFNMSNHDFLGPQGCSVYLITFLIYSHPPISPFLVLCSGHFGDGTDISIKTTMCTQRNAISGPGLDDRCDALKGLSQSAHSGKLATATFWRHSIMIDKLSQAGVQSCGVRSTYFSSTLMYVLCGDCLFLFLCDLLLFYIFEQNLRLA